MRFLTFRRLGEHTAALGIDIEDGATIVDLRLTYPGEPACASMQAMIASGERGLDLAREAASRPRSRAVLTRREVALLPPIAPTVLRDTGLIRTHLRPIRTQMCHWIGAHTDDDRSFEELIEWMGMQPDPGRRLGFAYRDGTELTAPNEVVRRPATSALLDYELELAVVIGRAGRNIDPADAENHIFGYTIYNDWSLRDVQIRGLLAGDGVHGAAKDFPGSNTLGPSIVTKDEIPDPYSLAMSVRVNGETWGSGSTEQAWTTFADAVSQISRDTGIVSGEVWGSGTVRNGSSFELGRQLPNEAYVELEIERLGILSNYVLPAAQPA